MKTTHQFVVYFNDEETASPDINEAMEQKRVHLRKSLSYFRERRMGRAQNEGSLSTY